MRIAIGIPARLASTRFPRKLLAPLAGKPVLAHTIERAKEADLGEVFVATADREIAELARHCGANVRLTSADHPNGTSRLAEAARTLDAEIIVNLQGDEPLVHAETLRAVVDALRHDEEVPMATAACPITDEARFFDPHTVKVVCNQTGRALYFSRSPIPHGAPSLALAHLGIYAYRKDFLIGYPSLPPSRLEQAERLEQLRALAHGFSIAVAVVEEATPIGIDTPEDLMRAQAMLEGRS